MEPISLSQMAEAWVIMGIIAFARVGTATILLPGFGETQIQPRFKIAFGALLTLGLLPALPINDLPDNPALLAGLLAMEITIGAFIGIGARVMLYALHMLGAQVGFASSLNNALLPNQGSAEGGSAVAAILTSGAIALMFATDLHHLMLSGILRSYTIMPPGRIMPGDMADQMARIGGGAFYAAATMGAPFFVLSLMVNLGLGLANRVMPQMQVFFVALPGLIILGLTVLVYAAPAMMDHQIFALADWFQTFTK